MSKFIKLLSYLGFAGVLNAQVDPATNPMLDMTRIGHTMVFLAVTIGVAGIGFRILVASRKRAARTQQAPYAMPWQPPQPPQPQNIQETTLGVFCPRCGVRGAAAYCVSCGYDLQAVARQVHGQFMGDRA